MSSIGLLGGTFDPIHRGHLDVARAARHALGLAEVWLVPARLPPHRGAPAASAAHRFAMAALATAADSWLRVHDAEMERAGPSFTIDTLDALEARHPPLRGQFVFVTGVDAFREVRTWRRWRDVVDRCHFAVVSRAGYPAGSLRTDVPELADRMRNAPCPLTPQPAIFLVDARTADVSASAVRAALAAGESAEGLVPAPVAEYATRHRLYVDTTVEETHTG